jgi:imidazolonepropionase
MAWDSAGEILDLGTPEELRSRYRYTEAIWLDAGGRVVTPGLIDSHTHAVNAGSRASEFVMRCKGADYMEILAAGGGILNSADRTRKASIGELLRVGRAALERSLSFGVTTLEAKSGYGLDTETELKMLRAIRILGETQPVRLKATFCGAHAVPREFRENPDGYVDLVICSRGSPRSNSRTFATCSSNRALSVWSRAAAFWKREWLSG